MALGMGIGIGLMSTSRRIFSPDDGSLGTLLVWGRSDDPDAVIDTSPDPDEFTSLRLRGSLDAGTSTWGGGSSKPQVSSAFDVDPAAALSGGRRFTASIAASSFARLHNSTDSCTWYQRFRISSLGSINTLGGTFNNGDANIGYTQVVGTTGILTVGVGNGSARTLIQSDAGAVVVDTDYTIVYTKAADGITVHLGTTEIGSDTITSPSASDPSHTLVIGANNTGSVPLVGWSTEWALFDGAHSASRRAKMLSYLDRWQFSA